MPRDLRQKTPSTMDPESTASLILRIRRGDETAEERLMRRFLPRLQSWAHGRLPSPARHLADTDDLVQNTFIKTLKRVKGFEPRHRGAFFAYLRRALQNQIRDQLRSARHRPGRQLLREPAAADPSPLEEAIGNDRLRAYEAALDRLEEAQKEAVVLRVELGLGYKEIADVIGSPTPNAARMVVSRALVRLSELMDVG